MSGRDGLDLMSNICIPGARSTGYNDKFGEREFSPSYVGMVEWRTVVKDLGLFSMTRYDGTTCVFRWQADYQSCEHSWGLFRTRNTSEHIVPCSMISRTPGGA